jgi:solute carrier family 25 carnitine/acylcarnitine transporter 20/29
VENVEADYTEMFIAGSVAGAGMIFVSCPVDLIKLKLQSSVSSPQYTGPINVSKSIYRSNGVRGLYRGMPAMAMR